MKNKTLTAAALATFIAGALVVNFIGGNAGDVEICTPKGCEVYSREQYVSAKSEYARIVESERALTWDELETLTAILETEAKAHGGLDWGSVKDTNELRQKITTTLYEND